MEIAGKVAQAVTGAQLASPRAFVAGLQVPPFLIFLIGGPIVVWLLKGRTRQAALVILAGLALIDAVTLSHTSSWTLPFMGYNLVLLKVDTLSYLMGVIFSTITFLAVLYAAGFAKPWMHLFAMLYAGTSMGVVFAATGSLFSFSGSLWQLPQYY